MLQHTLNSQQWFRTFSCTELAMDFDFWLASDISDSCYNLDAPLYIPTGAHRSLSETCIATEFVPREQREYHEVKV